MAYGSGVDQASLRRVLTMLRSVEPAVRQEVETHALPASATELQLTMRTILHGHRRRSPTATALLSGSIDIVSGGLTRLVGVISGPPWAWYVEYGSRHEAAQPFVRPAFDLRGPNFIKRAEQDVSNVVRRVQR